ncbi:MBL fold metallo-hydrolase [Chryseomicrobium palamuruense]
MKITTIGMWGGYPEKGEATSSFLVEQDGFSLIVDCGSAVLSTLLTMKDVHELDAFLISHYHPDHIADVGVLQHAAMIHKQLGNLHHPIPIYAHAQDSLEFSKLSYKGVTTGMELEAYASYSIGPFKVSTCPTVHPVYCLAFRIEVAGKAVVFTADTEWTDALVTFSQGANVLVSESNVYPQYAGKIQGHLTGQQAGLLAAQSGVERLVLTHLPQYGDREILVTEAKKEFSGPVELAYTKQQILL